MSAVPGGQKMGPDIERLIGHLEEAQDAVGGWAPGVPVPSNNAVLMENLNKETLAVNALPKCEKTNFVFTSSESLTKNAWLGLLKYKSGSFLFQHFACLTFVFEIFSFFKFLALIKSEKL